MSKKNPHWMIPAAIATLAFAGCAPAAPQAAAPGHAPSNWYEKNDTAPAAPVAEDAPALAPTVDRVLDSTTSALEEQDATAAPVASALPPSATAGTVPWHLEYLMTDLGLSVSGKLGVLSYKGTPSVTLSWRRQHEGAKPASPLSEMQQGDGQSDVILGEETSVADLSAQLEPAIQAAVRSGQVNDERTLRKKLQAVGEDFLSLAQGMDAAAGSEGGNSEWWAQRLRLDVIVDASGNIVTVPGLSVGGDVRFRFEWFRNQPKHASKKALSERARRFQEEITAYAQDLDAISADDGRLHGYKAYCFRVGLGVSAQGTLGIVTGTGQVLGQVYFMRTGVPKPVVHAPVSPEHAKFQEGLHEATKMAAFFARHAARKNAGTWKVWELRTTFDLSVSGALKLATVGGLASAEVMYYNENF